MDEPVTVGGTEYLDMRRPARPSPDWPATALFYTLVLVVAIIVSGVSLFVTWLILSAVSFLWSMPYDVVWAASGGVLSVVLGVLMFIALFVWFCLVPLKLMLPEDDTAR